MSYSKVGKQVYDIYTFEYVCLKCEFCIPREEKLNLRTISGYFLGYAQLNSKGYRFYYPYVELRNAKFLENNLISGNDKFQNIIPKKDNHETQLFISSDKLAIVYTPQVQIGIRRSTNIIPQAANIDQVDQIVHDEQSKIVEHPLDIVSQPVE